MINRDNFLILAGGGRNVGKTTLACKLIEKVKSEKVIALKITPHFHESGCKLVYKTEYYTISLEENRSSHKDTSKMLVAGASQVYYIQANDEHIPEVLRHLLPKLSSKCPVICESGALRNYIKPGVFLMLSKSGVAPKNIDFVEKADLLILDYQYPQENLHFANGTWFMD